MRRDLAAFDLGGPLVGSWAAALAGLEAARPLRGRTLSRRRRWRANGLLGVLAGAVVRLAVLPAMVAVARRCEGRGLLARVPEPLRLPVGLVLLDGSVWLWHRANHEVSFLWRFHAQHHTDPDLDVTTAARFHVGELLASIAPRSAAVALLGASPRTVVTYELLMQAATFFHHANLRLPAGLDEALTALVVTPRMHGIHHSQRGAELQSNWGVVLTAWDRLAGTLRLDVAQETIVIGIPDQPGPVPASDARDVLLSAFTSRASGRRCGRRGRAPA